jgi:excisionase family DNA binding protein
MSEPLLDPDAAAERLGVSVRWIRRAVAERRLPFIKVGRFVRFRPADLDAYIAAQLVPAGGEAA